MPDISFAGPRGRPADKDNRIVAELERRSERVAAAFVAARWLARLRDGVLAIASSAL